MIKFRSIPRRCNPLCDTLIFSFPEKKMTKDFISLITDAGMGTKNVPDAIEWHFARYWSHIFNNFGISTDQLFEITQPSANILDKSVAIPIMVRTKKVEMKKNAQILHDSLIKLY